MAANNANNKSKVFMSSVGLSDSDALYEMQQLRVEVQKYIDGKPQGDPEYLPPDKKHKLVRDLGWVVPQNHKWGDNRWTVYKQRVLELWPRHLKRQA